MNSNGTKKTTFSHHAAKVLVVAKPLDLRVLAVDEQTVSDVVHHVPTGNGLFLLNRFLCVCPEPVLLK